MSNHEIATPDLKKATQLFWSYLVGFVLSVVFAVLSFYLVTSQLLATNAMLYTALTVLVILQLLVQSVFFFRLNTHSSDDRWNFLIFVFSLLIMLIVVSGSLWIMYNLNYYMVN
jgi:cytochrome o ubiquinol oxidase operon protein cyoD